MTREEHRIYDTRLFDLHLNFPTVFHSCEFF